MSVYTQILYQIVFSTSTETKHYSKQTGNYFSVMSGVYWNKKKCTLYQINGVEDHIHIATHIHPSVALADLVKDIKVASSIWIKEKRIFPDFSSWQEGYGAFTYSIKEKDSLMYYIKNQKEHHKKISYKEEYIKLLNEHGINFDERYLL